MTVKGLRVSAQRASFWRCGRRWTSEPIELPIDTLTTGEVATLRAEAQLVVEDIDLDIEVDTNTDPNLALVSPAATKASPTAKTKAKPKAKPKAKATPPPTV